jgi:hypothetical protein
MCPWIKSKPCYLSLIVDRKDSVLLDPFRISFHPNNRCDRALLLNLDALHLDLRTVGVGDVTQ